MLEEALGGEDFFSGWVEETSPWLVEALAKGLIPF